MMNLMILLTPLILTQKLAATPEIFPQESQNLIINERSRKNQRKSFMQFKEKVNNQFRNELLITGKKNRVTQEGKKCLKWWKFKEKWINGCTMISNGQEQDREWCQIDSK